MGLIQTARNLGARIWIRRGGWDGLLAAALIAAGLLGVSLAYHPGLWSSLMESQGADGSIASLLREQGGVRYRVHDSPIWHDIPESQDLAPGDAVFTGSDGTASLHMAEGSAVKILPNSLIVVQQPVRVSKSETPWFSRLLRRITGAVEGPPPPIKVTQGKIALSLKKGAPAIKIQARNRTYEITADSDEADVEVELEHDSNAATADEEDDVRFSAANQTSRVSIRPESGSATDTIHVAGGQIARAATESGKIALRGANEAKAPKAPIPVILAQTPPKPLPSLAPVAAPPAPPVEKPKPVAVGTPALVAPDRNATESTLQEIVLSWKPVARAHQYRVQVSQDPAFKGSLFFDQLQPLMAAALPDTPSGLYHWRVRADEGAWSETRSFKVVAVQAPKLFSPRAPVPASGAVVRAGLPLTLRWQRPAKTAPRFRVQVFDGSGLTRKLVDQVQEASTYVLRGLKAGNYFWRVRTMGRGGARSDWTAPAQFSVK